MDPLMNEERLGTQSPAQAVVDAYAAEYLEMGFIPSWFDFGTQTPPAPVFPSKLPRAGAPSAGRHYFTTGSAGGSSLHYRVMTEALYDRTSGARVGTLVVAIPLTELSKTVNQLRWIEALVTGSALTITATIEPTGDVPVPVAFGFHPYLQIPDLRRAEWQVALPVRRQLELDERQIPTGQSRPVRIEASPLGDTHYDDGFSELDSRYTLETASGELILVQNRGIRHAAADVMRRLLAGESVDPSAVYFRTIPTFETSAPRLQWLSRSVFIGIGERKPLSVVIQFWRVA